MSIDASVAAIGAAIIAGIISLVSLILSKEQKISEFRQSWINDLRQCFISYISNMASVADIINLKKNGLVVDNAILIAQYRSLNDASNGIKLRINIKEATSIALTGVMDEFEKISKNNDSFTNESINQIEEDFLKAANNLLKFEWDRVKEGEPVFRHAKTATILTTIALVGSVVVYLFMQPSSTSTPSQVTAAVSASIPPQSDFSATEKIDKTKH